MDYFWLSLGMVAICCFACGFTSYWLAVDKTDRQWQERFALERRRRLAAESRIHRMEAP